MADRQHRERISLCDRFFGMHGSERWSQQVRLTADDAAPTSRARAASRVHGLMAWMLMLAVLSGGALMAVSGCSGGFGSVKATLSSVTGTAETVVSGKSVTFTATATGTGPFSYQWYVNGTLISGATSNTYTISQTTSSMNGNTYTVVVTNPAGSTSLDYTLTVNTPPSITTAPASQEVTAGQTASFSVAASGTSPLSYQWYVNGAAISGATSSSYTTPATAALGTFQYTCVVTNVAGSVTSSAATLTVDPITPTLAFSSIASHAYGDASFSVAASSASSGAVTYSVASGPATVSGSMVTLTGVGTVTLNATQVASGLYSAASATTSFVVTKSSPTVSSMPTGSSLTYGQTLASSTLSGGSVIYSGTGANVAGSWAWTDSTTVPGVGTNSYAVTFTPTDTTDNSTVSGTASVTVAKATPTISTALAASSLTYGQALSASTLSGGVVVNPNNAATVAGTWSWTSSTTVPAVGTASYAVTFTPTDTTDYNTVSSTVSVVVAKATPTISTTLTASSLTYNQALSASTLSGGVMVNAVTGATVAGTWTWTSSSTVPGEGTASYAVTFTPTDTTDYSTVSSTVSVTVAQPTLTVSTVPTASSLTYGQKLSASTLSGGSVINATTSAAVAGTWAWTSPTTTPDAGTASYAVTFTPTDTTNYNAVSSTVSVTVAQATPTLTLASISNMAYGSVTSVTASATSASSGTITYSVSGPATVSGATVTITGVGTITVVATQAATTDYVSATASTSFTVSKGTPTVSVWPTASSLAIGQTLASSTLSGGTASVGGSFAWTTSSTVPAVGTASQSVTFTPTDSTNYSSVTGTASVTTTGVTLGGISSAVSGVTVKPGSYSFSDTATGGATNTLSWSDSSGGSDFSPTTTSSGLSTTWASPTLAGTYTVTAASVDESSVTNTTSVTISKPVITTQPASKNACTGYSTSLSVAANYADSYQWYKGSTAIPSATSTTLTLSNLASGSSGDSGSYYCAVSNGSGANVVNSNTVTLNVTSGSKPTVSAPASASVWAGQTATFSVSASGGTGTMTYQWYKNTTNSNSTGTLISGATKSTYTTGALTTSDSGTYYYATVLDGDCTSTTQTSSTAALTVSGSITTIPPSIVTQPTGQTTTSTGTATFTVVASDANGESASDLSYQWYYVAYASSGMGATPGTLISGATSASYTLSSPSGKDGYQYYVIVSNAYGQAVSNRVTLAVGAGIQVQIDDQPQSQYITSGNTAAFSVTASCTSCTAAYQWYWMAPGSSTATALSDTSSSSDSYLSGASISGSTSSSVTISSTPVTASGGVFYVVITSTDGSAQISGTEPLTSSKASLFVNSVGSVGSSTAGQGLCNSGSAWTLNGSNPQSGTDSSQTSYVPYQNTSTCAVTMTSTAVNIYDATNCSGYCGAGAGQKASIFWPKLISTAKFEVSFTVTVSHGSTVADGFTMMLADPSSGATTTSVGSTGYGLGAAGIPGFVLGFDTYQNGNLSTSSTCTTTYTYSSTTYTTKCDPAYVPYLGVGRGEPKLWETPWSYVNSHLIGTESTNTLYDYYQKPTTFADGTSHSYVVSATSGVMTVTMDGNEVFSGSVTMPPSAYLGFTASTGGSTETVVFSNLTATVSEP